VTEEPSWNDRAAKSLDKAMEYLGTWIVLGLVGLAAAVLAGFATDWARPSQSAWAVGVSQGLLALTLLAILWYSLETRRLVRQQRDAAEITDHPWLSALWVEVADVPPGDAVPFGGIQASLPIENRGRTPAMLRDVTVSSEGEGQPNEWTVTLGGDHDPRTLVPGEQVIVKIADVAYGDLRHPTLSIKVSIHYRTVHGGTGNLMLRYRLSDRIWKSRDTSYTCTLSSGAILPRSTDSAKGNQ